MIPYMPEEAIRSGRIDMYADDDLQIERDVKIYNKYIENCRILKKDAFYAKSAFFVANPVMVFGILFLNLNTAFSRGALAYCMLGIYIVGFFMFAFVMKNLIFAAAVTPLLMVLDITFLSLVILNALLVFLFERLDRQIRDHPTYPVFFEVELHYIKRNRPKDPNDTVRRL